MPKRDDEKFNAVFQYLQAGFPPESVKEYTGASLRFIYDVKKAYPLWFGYSRSYGQNE